MHFDITTLVSGCVTGGLGAKALDLIAAKMQQRQNARTQKSTDESALRDDQRDLIGALKTGATDWTTLVSSYLESVRDNAKLTVQIANMEARLSRLEAAIANHDQEKADWERERGDWDMERCGLENEILDQRRQLEMRDAEIGSLNQRIADQSILVENSARAQQFAEGAAVQATRTIQALAKVDAGPAKGDA